MSERRALLDTDMYKISEEDSQDEEVLSSLNKLTLGSGAVSVIPAGSSGTGASGSKKRNPVTHNFPLSLNNGNLRKAQLEGNQSDRRSKVSQDPTVEWPSSSGSGSDESDVSDSSLSRGTESDGSSSSEKTWKPTKQFRSRKPGTQRSTEEESDENYSSSTSTCSSCVSLEGSRSRRSTRRRRADTQSSSSSEEDSQPLGNGHSSRRRNPLSNDSNFITEAEVKALMTPSGSVSLVEYYAASELSEVADDSSLCSSTLQSGVSRAPGTLDIVSETGSTETDPPSSSTSSILKAEQRDRQEQEEALSSFQVIKRRKEEKGMLSRFLKRSRGAKGKADLEEQMTKGESRGRPGGGKEPKVFRFKDEAEGEIRYVQLDLTSWELRSNLLGRRARLIESMLGIIPGRFSVPSASASSPSAPATAASSLSKLEVDDDRIMVAGFVPDGPAARSGQIKIGDWLYSVEARLVTTGSVDSYLATLPPAVAVPDDHFDAMDHSMPLAWTKERFPAPRHERGYIPEEPPFLGKIRKSDLETRPADPSNPMLKEPRGPDKRKKSLGRLFSSATVVPDDYLPDERQEVVWVYKRAPRRRGPLPKKEPLSYRRYGKSPSNSASAASSTAESGVPSFSSISQQSSKTPSCSDTLKSDDALWSVIKRPDSCNTDASSMDEHGDFIQSITAQQSVDSMPEDFYYDDPISHEFEQFSFEPGEEEPVRPRGWQVPSTDSFPSWEEKVSRQLAHDLKITVGVKKVASTLIPEPELEPVPEVVPEVELGEKDSLVQLIENGDAIDTRLDRTQLPMEVLSDLAIVFIGMPGPPEIPTDYELQKDVLYSWPPKPPNADKKTERMAKKLVNEIKKSQGIYDTLYDLLPHLGGYHPVQAKLRIGEDMIDVSFWSDDGGESLLLFAINLGPETRVKRHSAAGIMDRLRSVLSFLLGPLYRAFGPQSMVEAQDLDRFISNTLATILHHQYQDFLFTGTPVTLRLPPNRREYVQHLMYRFETRTSLDRRQQESNYVCTEPDFLRQEAEYYYDCLGSSVYYKGKLLVSTLSPKATDKVYAALLTELNAWDGRDWKCVNRLFLWRQTFLKEGDESHGSECYTAVVGTQYFTFAFLLRPVVTNEATTRDVPLKWIRRAFNLVNHLMTANVESEINQTNDLYQFLSEISAEIDELEPTGSKSSSKKGKSKKSNQSHDSPSIFKAEKVPKPDNIVWLRHVMRIDPAVIEAVTAHSKTPKGKKRYIIPPFYQHYVTEVVKNYVPPPPEPKPDKKANKKGAKASGGGTNTNSSGPSSPKLSGSLSTGSQPSTQGAANQDQSTTVPLEVMRGNVLLSVIHLDHGNGYFVSSHGISGKEYEHVLFAFRRSASITHEILTKAYKARKALANIKSPERKLVNTALAPFCEHGTLFECEIEHENIKKKKKTKPLTVQFWVVGRLYDDNHETYVCYEEGTMSQNIIETAFKISQKAVDEY